MWSKVMEYLIAIILITLRVFRELIMVAVGMAWFVLCAAGGLILLVGGIIVYAFTKKPSI